MNQQQEKWWQQARSDLDVLVLLRQRGAGACHQLHYLQMVAEKIGKAYYWGRSKGPPPKSHAGFVQFLRFLASVRPQQQERIAEVFEFGRFDDFQSWLPTVLPLAYELERLTPDLASDGPNCEYPWPHASPLHAPAGYPFTIWEELTNTGRGRRLIHVIQYAVTRFPAFA